MVVYPYTSFVLFVLIPRYFEVVHTVRLLDITSVFDKQIAHWIKNTVIKSLVPHVSALLCHLYGGQNLAHVYHYDGIKMPKCVGVEF